MGFPKILKKVTSPFTDAAQAAGSYVAPGSGFADAAGRAGRGIQRNTAVTFRNAQASQQKAADRATNPVTRFVQGESANITGAVARFAEKPTSVRRAGAAAFSLAELLPLGGLEGVGEKGAVGVASRFRFAEELGAKNAGKLRTAGELAAKGKSVGKAAYSGARSGSIPDLSTTLRAAAEAVPEVVARAKPAAKAAATAGTSAAVDIRGIATGTAEANKARLASVTAKIAEGAPKATGKSPKGLLASGARKIGRVGKSAFVDPIKDIATGVKGVKNAEGIGGKARAVGTAAKHTPGLGFHVAAVTAPASYIGYGAIRETVNQVRGSGNVAEAETPDKVAAAFGKVKAKYGEQGLEALTSGLEHAKLKTGGDFSKLSDAALKDLLRSSVRAQAKRLQLKT